MVNLGASSKLAVMVLVVLGVLFARSVQAAVTYEFVMSSGTLIAKHKPFLAEIELSDSAVQAGQATSSDINSIKIIGGQYMPQADPVIFSDLHAHFIDIAVTLSSDRKTITSFYAENSQNMEQNDYWIFHQWDPNAPGQNVHDNVVRVSAEAVILWTLLLPNNDYAISSLAGQWRRERIQFHCWICDIFKELVLDCFPWCPWPWILIGSIFILVIIVWYVKKIRKG